MSSRLPGTRTTTGWAFDLTWPPPWPPACLLQVPVAMLFEAEGLAACGLVRWQARDRTWYKVTRDAAVLVQGEGVGGGRQGGQGGAPTAWGMYACMPHAVSVAWARGCSTAWEFVVSLQGRSGVHTVSQPVQVVSAQQVYVYAWGLCWCIHAPRVCMHVCVASCHAALPSAVSRLPPEPQALCVVPAPQVSRCTPQSRGSAWPAWCANQVQEGPAARRRAWRRCRAPCAT